MDLKTNEFGLVNTDGSLLFPNQTSRREAPFPSGLGWKTPFHWRPVAFGEMIIFTTTSLGRTKILQFLPLRPPLGRTTKTCFCVGSDGYIRVDESHSTREGCDCDDWTLTKSQVKEKFAWRILRRLRPPSSSCSPLSVVLSWSYSVSCSSGWRRVLEDLNPHSLGSPSALESLFNWKNSVSPGLIIDYLFYK